MFKTLRAAQVDGELILVDDQSDQTERTRGIVRQLQLEGYPIKIHVRMASDGKGLSSAVLLGFYKAENEVVLCMDADLQHEPESVPSVAGPVLRGEAEFSVGSRYVESGEVAGWSSFRKLISWGACLLARPLTTCNDPMSGFFCTSKDVISRGQGRIRATGWKIALELMAICQPANIVDVPITFQDRTKGESKLTARVYIHYLQQLWELYWELYKLHILFLLLFIFLFLGYIFKRVLG